MNTITSPCPHCREPIDDEVALGEVSNRTPAPGDVGICASCGFPHRFREIAGILVRSEITDDEWLDLPVEIRSQVRRVQQRVHERHRAAKLLGDRLDASRRKRGPVKIDQLFAYIMLDEDDHGCEGIPAFMKEGPMGMPIFMPMVGGSEHQQLNEKAQELADMKGKTIVLCRFSVREEIKRITPKGKEANAGGSPTGSSTQ